MEPYKNHINRALFERIEAYLLHTMDDATRLAFEQEMLTDEALRNEVHLQSRLLASAEVFSHTGEKQEGTGLSRIVSIKKWMRFSSYAAAAVAVILTMWWFQRNSYTTDKIVARYFTPDTGLPVVMSGENENYHFYDGMVSYKEEDYEKAIAIWMPLYQNNPGNDTLQYYLGVAYLNGNHNQAAVDFLTPVAENESSRWQQKSLWYLALAHLKNGNKKEALSLLRKLKDHEQAARLEKDIEKLSP
ncbi:MAG: tetratricopeptide repeat protein [Chitinophagaceae bacterium]|nr:tetratricopeptide repeat protein [Chitinophagaceae bacterium]